MSKNRLAAETSPKTAGEVELLTKLLFLRAVATGVGEVELLGRFLILLAINDALPAIPEEVSRWSEYLNWWIERGYVVRRIIHQEAKLILTPAGQALARGLYRAAKNKDIIIFPQVIPGSPKSPL